MKKKPTKRERFFKGVFDELKDIGKKEAGALSMSINIEENMLRIRAAMNDTCDLLFRTFSINEGKTRCFLAYIEGSVKIQMINENILKPLMSSQISNYFNIDSFIQHIMNATVSVCEVEKAPEMLNIVDKLLNGFSVLFVDQNPIGLALNTQGWEMRKSGEPEVEPSLRGPMESFVESININTALLRRRIKTPAFVMEKMEIGRMSSTTVILAYLKGIAEVGVIDEARSRLKKIDIDIVVDSGIIENFIVDSPFSLYPLIEFSQRPDTSALALSEGRVVVLVDGSPFVLIAPTVFSHFFSSTEDNYTSAVFTAAIVSIRYIAFLLALLAPSMFIAITTYHPEMIPYQLLSTLVASRSELPFPVLLEAVLMELTFELLREAGERLPRAIGSSLSIVGALVIGQAAVQSGLVSPAMVVIISATSTASFVNPKLNMSRAVRVQKLPFMILGATLGLFGIVMGGMVILIIMVSMRSLGVPYMSPFAPLKIKDWKTMVIKMPLWFANERPSSFQKNNLKRTSNNNMPKPPKGN